MYDIIGDLHGHYKHLVGILKQMGYTKQGDSFHHPDRKAIFVGDFINRGPQIKETISLIRKMVEQDDAMAIIGNHELNAILYTTRDKAGKFLGKRTAHYKLPLMKTLEAFAKQREEWEETVSWFRHLPLYIDLGAIRIVHGSWNSTHINTINHYKGEHEKMKRSFLKNFLKNPELRTALSQTIRGVELELPSDLIVRDNKGISHRKFRVRWWEPVDGKTFKDAAFGHKFVLPNYTIPPQLAPKVEVYESDMPIVFTGHFCLGNTPSILRPNICCVDSCITRTGVLTAYRWSGEKTLKEENIVRFSL